MNVQYGSRFDMYIVIPKCTEYTLNNTHIKLTSNDLALTQSFLNDLIKLHVC